jgi:hypothetical protein
MLGRNPRRIDEGISRSQNKETQQQKCVRENLHDDSSPVETDARRRLAHYAPATSGARSVGTEIGAELRHFHFSINQTCWIYSTGAPHICAPNADPD